MKRTYLKKTSKKQADKQSLWNEKVEAKILQDGYYCQWCGKDGHRRNKDDMFYLGGHHPIKRRFNVEQEPFICHNICHLFIEDHNIDVIKYPNKEVWLTKVKDEETTASK